jgi:hypothetical protein
MNIPNLHYIEDDWRFESSQRYRWPTEFEIRDALASVQQMGGTVVRSYTLSVRKPTDTPDVPRHVVGPGEFDETGFRALDLVLALAREYEIRLILPLVDNWQWWGGVGEYAAFRGQPREAFWSDPELIADFERTLEHVVLRRNTLTGQDYRDDPTILAWETGNELEAPWEWTARIAAALKRLDRAHPVIDGVHSRFIRPEALSSPDIDILSTHHYTPADVTVADIQNNLRAIAGKKPYFVGEFGFLPSSGAKAVLDAVNQGGAWGALLWSLRFHDRDGGFYWHCEKRGFEAYHWPGFTAGAAHEERAVLELMRTEAYAIRGLAPAPLSPPAAPVLLPDSSPEAISWQGSAGADSYLVERASADDGPWELLARDVSDAAHPYRPLFVDATAVPGRPYYYRVRAQNPAGASPPSQVAGPVSAPTRRLVDELVDFSLASSHAGTLELKHDDPRATKMDRERVEGQGGSLTYRLHGTLEEVRVYAFLRDDSQRVSLAGSRDGVRFEPLRSELTDFSGGADQPTTFRPVRLRAAGVGRRQSYLRIRLEGGAQIGRVEIAYWPAKPGE